MHLFLINIYICIDTTDKIYLHNNIYPKHEKQVYTSSLCTRTAH